MIQHAFVSIHTMVIYNLGQLRNRGDRGQTTAEYALVILGAAAVALLVLAWAAETGKVSTLLNKVIGSVADKVA